MENKNLFEQTSKQIDKAKDVGKNVFRNFINYITFGVMILATIVFSYAYIGFQNGFTISLLLQTGIIMIINVTAMIIFIPQGEDNEKNKSPTYNSNLILWSTKASIIEKFKKIMQFRKYCEVRTDELRQEKRNEYIFESGIDIEFYNQHFKELSIKELKRYKKENDLGIVLTKKEFHLLKKAKGNIRVKKFSYRKILAGAKSNSNSSALQERVVSYKTKSIMSKVATIIVYTAIIACVVFLPTGASGWVAVRYVALRILGVTVSVVMGFYTGVNSIKIANSDNKEKILFIDEFLETQTDIIEENK